MERKIFIHCTLSTSENLYRHLNMDKLSKEGNKGSNISEGKWLQTNIITRLLEENYRTENEDKNV